MTQSSKKRFPKGEAPVDKKNKRFIPTAVAVVFAALLFLKGCGEGTESESGGGAAVAENTDLVIQVKEISETAKFYPVEVDGTKFEVLAVKAPDGTIRTAFNTCEVCYDSGRGYYKQSGDKLVCQNCGNQFAMNRVEIEAGGCNPWPIFPENKTATDETITISSKFLAESKVIFSNWKREY